MKFQIRKVLSWNDCGRGRSHQSGVLLPLDVGRLIFSETELSTRNPKKQLNLRQLGDGPTITAVVTYYNSKAFGGTRNEFRVTRISQFIREAGLREGDTLELRFDVETCQGSLSYLRKLQN